MRRLVGGPSRRSVIGRATHWIECGVLALVLASCGGGDDGPSPTRLRSEPDSGDEQGIRYRVTVRATAKATTVEPPAIAAFLPADIVVLNRTRRPATVRIAGVGKRSIDRDGRAQLQTPGLKAGTYRIEAPGGRAELVVRAGG